MTQFCRSTKYIVAAGALLGFAVNSAPAQWRYYYFDEPQPLGLDVSRIAVLQRDGEAAATVATAVAKVGIAAEDVQSMSLPGWSYVASPAAARGENDVENLVAAIAADRQVEFVSPVFLDFKGDPLFITRHLHVGFHDTVDHKRAEAILNEAGAGMIEERDYSRMKGVYRLLSRSRDGFEVLKKANELVQRPEVKFAEPDMIFTARTDFIPNDPGFANVWGAENFGQIGSRCDGNPPGAGTPDMDMDGPEAWDITIGDPSVIVVIMDIGIDQSHPDLNQIPGIDFTGSGTGGGPANACDNHGTQVGGCVSAIINNALGTVGIAPGCKVVSAKWGVSAAETPPCGNAFFGSASGLINSLDFAETIGARITQSSFGSGPSASVTTKYSTTRDAGVLHFGSAGNDGTSTIGYPANLSVVNAVAALARTGNLAGFSTFGDGLAFSAPGCDIYTTDTTGPNGFPGDFGFVNGTSFAGPYACGVAALLFSVDPTFSLDDVERIMQETSVDLGAPGFDTMFGWGFVNAHQALLASSRPIHTCGLSKLTATDAAESDQFGSSASISGDVAVVGAFLDDCVDGSFDCGSAYLYRFNGSSWLQEVKLTALDAASNDFFGDSVSIGGDVAVVGASRDDDACLPTEDPNCNSGSAYIFRFNGVSWEQEQKLAALDAAPTDFYGNSVSISEGGDVVAVGAFVADCGDGPSCGSAYVYRHNGVAWIEEVKLTASDIALGDLFGDSVSINASGDVVVVGARGDDCSDGSSNCGSTYVYRHNGVDWVEEAKLIASDAATSDLFGDAVSISGDVAVVGARLDECEDGSSNCGSVYVYRFDGVNWIEEAKLVAVLDAGAGDSFGESVSVSGDIAVVGARGDNCGCCGVGSTACGSVYVYRYDGSTWIEESKLTASDAAGDDRFGQSVSLSGNTVVVGAFHDDCADESADCGAAYLFAVSSDCNFNGIVDTCDILDGTSVDQDGDGVPDGCSCIAPAAAQPDVLGAKNRYLAFTAGVPGGSHAIRVTFNDLPPPHDLLNGVTMWVGPSQDTSENSAAIEPIPNFPTFKAATLQCEPFFTDWSTVGTVHVFHESIVPGGTYMVQLIEAGCLPIVEGNFSAPLEIMQARWGDTVENCATIPCPPPDGVTNILDVLALVDKFINAPGAITKARADLVNTNATIGGCVDLKVNIVDVLRSVDALLGLPYPFALGATDPCASTCPNVLP